jgi:hypothetical protein
VRYVIEGVDVTPQVVDGGYELADLEEGPTKVRVIGHHLPSWDVSCPIKVTSNDRYHRVHDGLTLAFLRR